MTELAKEAIARPNFKKVWPYIWTFTQIALSVTATIILLRSH